MKLCSLASGSGGNASLLKHGKTRFLIDIGISKKALISELNDLEQNIHDINALFITHEHIDHIKGLGPLLRAYHIPVYLTEGTYNAVMNYKGLGEVDKDLFNVIIPEKDYIIDNLTVRAIATDHDAAQPVAYKFSVDDISAAIVTDLGTYTESMVEQLRGIDACLIEANHDIRMLEMGPYPYQLKLRILSSNGHLSNDDCLKLICLLMKDKLKKVILGHLSNENNLPKIAYETIRQGINENGNTLTELLVAAPKGHSEWIKV